MDGFAKCIVGKKLINIYAIKPNISANADKAKGTYRNITSPNFFTILTIEPMTLINSVIANMDKHKPTTIVIPTCLSTRSAQYLSNDPEAIIPSGTQSAKYLINDHEVTIPCGDLYGINRHLDVFYELPSGTDRLKVEIVGIPGTILSIRNIQVYQ